MHLASIEAKTEQDTTDQDEHIKQIMEQNASVLALVQEQKKNIEDLLIQSKSLIEAIVKEKATPVQPNNTTW